MPIGKLKSLASHLCGLHNLLLDMNHVIHINIDKPYLLLLIVGLENKIVNGLLTRVVQRASHLDNFYAILHLRHFFSSCENSFLSLVDGNKKTGLKSVTFIVENIQGVQ